jgi:predicted metal-binding membrane protein
VTVLAGRLVRTGGPSLRAIDRRHPEWWVPPLVAAAWIGLVGAALVRSVPGGPADGGGYATLFVCPLVGPSSGGDGLGAALGAGLGSIAMIVAMMGILVVPVLHHVGHSGLWARRRRGPALVFAAFIATWLPVVLMIDLAVAGLVLPWKRRALRRCTRLVPIVPRGWRADVGCLRLGVVAGQSCVLACAGSMLVVAAAGHGPLAMAILAVAQLRDRRDRRARALPGALAVLVVGTGALLATALG